MTITPRQMSETVFQTMLQGFVDCVCDRPGDTPERRVSRVLEVTAAVEGLAPRDAAEMMLAGLTVVHAHLIQDAARDLVQEPDARPRARAKSALVALGRVMTGFLRELRIARKRPLTDCVVAEAVPEPAAAPVTVAAERTKEAAEGGARPVAKPARQPPMPPVRPSRDLRPTPPTPLLSPGRTTGGSVAAMLAAWSPPDFSLQAVLARPLRAPLTVASPA